MERSKYKLGITRVFFRAGQLAFLEKLTGQGDVSAEEIVSRVTTWLHVRRKRMIRLGLLTNLVFSRMLRVIRLARMLQSASRILLPLQRWCNRATATRRNRAAAAIQAAARCSAAKRRWRKQLHGVTLLQKRSRGLLARKKHTKLFQVQKMRQEAANAVRADHARRRMTRMSAAVGADLKRAQQLHQAKEAGVAASPGPRRAPAGVMKIAEVPASPASGMAMSSEASETLNQLLELAKQQRCAWAHPLHYRCMTVTRPFQRCAWARGCDAAVTWL